MQIARKIKENVRENDFVDRYGGDEFVILSTNVTVAEANKICKRILDSIGQVGPTKSGITGSIGLTIPKEIKQPETYMNMELRLLNLLFNFAYLSGSV